MIVNTQLGLTELQIAPTTGTLEILSPVTAFTFAQALDSLGGSDAQSNSVQDSATSANAESTSIGLGFQTHENDDSRPPDRESPP